MTSSLRPLPEALFAPEKGVPPIRREQEGYLGDNAPKTKLRHLVACLKRGRFDVVSPPKSAIPIRRNDVTDDINPDRQSSPPPQWETAARLESVEICTWVIRFSANVGRRKLHKEERHTCGE